MLVLACCIIFGSGKSLSWSQLKVWPVTEEAAAVAHSGSDHYQLSVSFCQGYFVCGVK